MKIRYILPVFLLVLSSCSSFLEENVYSSVAGDDMYKTFEQADLAVMGCYNSLSAKEGFRNKWQGLMVYGTDEARCYFSGKINNNFFRVSNFSHTAGDTHISGLYSNLYNGVIRCNDVIYNISRMQLDSATRNSFLAEASFLRAYYYFTLVQLWGDVRLSTDPPSFASVTERNLTRSSVADVYKQVVADIEFAKKYLPPKESISKKGRASKYAAFGMAARIYLTMASGSHWGVAGYESFDDRTYYQLAKENAQEVIKYGNYDLLDDYTAVFDWHNKYNAEIIFDVNFSIGGPGNGWVKMGGPSGGNGMGYGTNGWAGRNYCRPSAYLALCVFGHTALSVDESKGTIKSFQTEDIRFGTSIATFDLKTKEGEDGSPNNNLKGDVSNWSCFKFNLRQSDMPGFTWQNTPMNHPIMRYSEIYLILAEAAAMLNLNDSEAYDAWNKVRERARGTANPEYLRDLKPGDFATQDEMMDEMMDERLREFCFEGMRRTDLLRTSRLLYAIDQMKTRLTELGNALGNETFKEHILATDIYDTRYDVNVQPYHILFPIPQAEMNVVSNPDYRQNPGWKPAEIEEDLGDE